MQFDQHARDRQAQSKPLPARWRIGTSEESLEDVRQEVGCDTVSRISNSYACHVLDACGTHFNRAARISKLERVRQDIQEYLL